MRRGPSARPGPTPEPPASRGASRPTERALQAYLCVTCGTQYPPSEAPPGRCPVCEDPRQFVPASGQEWTTMERMRADGRRNVLAPLEPGLWALETTPSFAIGQCAYLLETPSGNILWEALSLLDEETTRAIHDRGGIAAIAVSHPHFHSAMVDWSRAFGDAPIYIHEGNREWVLRPDPRVTLWKGGRLDLAPGVALVHGGGHFDGSSMLHWEGGAEGRGELLSADTMHVVDDRRHVSFLWSVPNQVPLGRTAVTRLLEVQAPLRYDRVRGMERHRVIQHDGKAAVARSVDRHLRFIAS